MDCVCVHLQEILSPIYFIVVIVVLVLVVPTPYYPEVTDPGGQADVFSPPPFMSNFRSKSHADHWPLGS